MIKVNQDSREQHPWDFSFYDHIETQVVTLKTGDYGLVGCDLCIERKASPAEIALNLGKKKKQFDAEMERLSKYKYKYIICEFSVANLLEFPKNSGIPKAQIAKVRMNPSYIIKCLNEYRDKYNIEIIFANSRDGAIDIVLEIFNEVINEVS